MSKGQPDFWATFVPAQAVFGGGQTSHTENEEATIAPGGTHDFIQYTIPTGYEYHICSIGICSSFPGISRYRVLINDVDMGGAYYVMYRKIPLVPEAAFVIPAGYKYGIRLYNDDTVNHSFTATIYGFLQETGA